MNAPDILFQRAQRLLVDLADTLRALRNTSDERTKLIDKMRTAYEQRDENELICLVSELLKIEDSRRLTEEQANL